MNSKFQDRDDLTLLNSILPRFVGANHDVLPETALAECIESGNDYLLRIGEALAARVPDNSAIAGPCSYRFGHTQRSVLERLQRLLTCTLRLCEEAPGREFHQELVAIHRQIVAFADEVLPDEQIGEAV